MIYPTLYQVLARDWLIRLSANAERPFTLREVPDSELDRLATLGFQWIYLLGVWQTGLAGKQVSRLNDAWWPGYTAALSRFTEADIVGSPFAVQAYHAHADFGGDDALADFRSRLRSHGLRLMLDFVPNHTAIDHEWACQYPWRYIQGTQVDLAREPWNFVSCECQGGTRIFAHGRDPYFPGWVDTLQLDYSNSETRSAMQSTLQKIAEQCDGVRCDMAMLLLPGVFERTWHRNMAPFWAPTICAAKETNPDLVVIAEVYWGLEAALQEQGFDFTYDKTLYDRLLARNADAVRAHLNADPGYQRKLARFLENHDEPRIAAEMTKEEHKAAATITYTVPGLRFFHDGQLEGARRKPSIHLGRREREPLDLEIHKFYLALLTHLKHGAAQGDWHLLPQRPAWEGNPTDRCFVCSAWTTHGALHYLTAVNFCDKQSQCYVPLQFECLRGRNVLFRDLLSEARYERCGDGLVERGLFLDVPGWGAHLFSIE